MNSNNFTYYTDSNDKASKFSLSTEPIVIRMDSNNNINRSITSSINVNYGSNGIFKPSNNYYNR